MLNKFIKNKIKNSDNFITNLVEKEQGLHVIKLFRIAFFSWVLFQTLLLIPYANDIMSPEAFILRKKFNSSMLHWFTNLSTHPLIHPHFIFFIVAQIVLATLGILGRSLRITIFLTWFTTLNINTLSYIVTDGGSNISELIFFYMLFMNTSGVPIKEKHDGIIRNILIGLNNIAFMIAKIQIVIVYLCTGIFKLNGNLWQNGMALYYILQSEAYSLPTLMNIIKNHPWISFLGTYTAVSFQITFPYLIWFKKTKGYIIALGCAIHMGIFFGMGLPTFGLMMCISYILFFENSWADKILSTSHSLQKKVTSSFSKSKEQRPNYSKDFSKA